MVRNPDDAQDLTQEVFAKAFRHLARYQPQFAFSTWLLRITTNHCIDFLRRKKRVPTQFLQAAFVSNDEDSLLPEMRDQCLDPQESYIRQQRIELVQRVVARLPAKYATLVRLRYFQELSYEEIALELQLPVGTVKANLFRACALLLELLGSSNTAR